MPWSKGKQKTEKVPGANWQKNRIFAILYFLVKELAELMALLIE